MNKEYKEIFLQNKNLIDQEIAKYFNNESKIEEAMLYSMEDGKRVRATLFLETRKLSLKEISKNDFLFALAIEMVQAYSLVHDDLPAMDNDDYRRGKESVHKHFGEDLGILTGDALLNEASKIIMEVSLNDTSYLRAGVYLLEKVGLSGMIEGQILDLRRRNNYDKDFLIEVYDKKTADFFKACTVAAGLVNGFSDQEIKRLENYAYYLGLGFQLQDDLLEEDYGDEINILSLMDYDHAKKWLDEINEKCKSEIEKFDNNEMLSFLIEFLSKREY